MDNTEKSQVAPGKTSEALPETAAEDNNLAGTAVSPASSAPRVFIINTDPRNSDILSRCLKTMHPDDILYLMGDGVNALLDDELFDVLTDVPSLYVSSYDMTARGINVFCGEEANAAQLVELVSKYGSPVTFK
ncbi:DsrH/TusB family sulfur metabolism protein [Succinimonas sp.]|uniref:DsrH/TusB family sulfur metabolism protein n=1 Tax=Succinimonas sp. TaxID=1936151 RepID=UPI00386B90BD